MKHFLYIFLLISLSVNYFAAADSCCHKVIINIKDAAKIDVPDYEFQILNNDNSLKENAKTDKDGVYVTTLEKGATFQAFFNKLEQDVIYDFKIPEKDRLKQYKLVLRLPVPLVAEADTDDDVSRKKSDRELDISIILQNKQQTMLFNHDFKLYKKDNILIAEAKTDNYGVFNIMLKEYEEYFIKTNVYGEDYSEDFKVPSGMLKYTFKLILPFPDTASQGQKYLRSYTLDNILFESGSAELTPESFPHLDKFVDDLRTHPRKAVEIAGHTDNVGTDEDNIVLSLARAEAIVNYSTGKGISKKRLVPRGYGESAPIATNETEEGRSKNRRIEVRVIKE